MGKTNNDHLAMSKKTEIIMLHEQNVSKSEIARRLGISRPTVQKWVHQYDKLGHVDHNRSGPKQGAFTEECQRHLDIVTAHANDAHLSTRDTATKYNVSLQTVRNHLRAAGIGFQKPRKPVLSFLTEQDKKNRVSFAKQYLNFDWCTNVVIFSDETSLRSCKDDYKNGLIKACRRRGQWCCYSDVNVLPRKSTSSICLKYWGWISSMGPGELVRVCKNNDSQGYLEYLRDVMMPSVRIAYPDSHIYFVQDSCATHKERNVQAWVKKQDYLSIIEWPIKSHDLNPVEDFWDHMVLNWDSSDVRLEAELDAMTSASWDGMRGSQFCWEMVSGMRSRLQQVIDSDGALIVKQSNDQ